MPTGRLNGFLTLKDIVYWIVIAGTLVGPYFLHERRIGDLASDIAVIKSQIIQINQRLEKSEKLSWVEQAN